MSTRFLVSMSLYMLCAFHYVRSDSRGSVKLPFHDVGTFGFAPGRQLKSFWLVFVRLVRTTLLVSWLARTLVRLDDRRVDCSALNVMTYLDNWETKNIWFHQFWPQKLVLPKTENGKPILLGHCKDWTGVVHKLVFRCNPAYRTVFR